MIQKQRTGIIICLLMNMQSLRLKTFKLKTKHYIKYLQIANFFLGIKETNFLTKPGAVSWNLSFLYCLSTPSIYTVNREQLDKVKWFSSWYDLPFCFVLSGMNSGIYICITTIIPFLECNMRRGKKKRFTKFFLLPIYFLPLLIANAFTQGLKKNKAKCNEQVPVYKAHTEHFRN